MGLPVAGAAWLTSAMAATSWLARPEIQLARVLPRADRALAFAWWTALLLRGLMPAAFALAMGALVGAVQEGRGLGAPLALVGTVFVGLQVLAPGGHPGTPGGVHGQLSQWLAMERKARAAVEDERKQGKRIVRKVVNISSTSGVNGNAGQVNYSAGKAAMVGVTKTLAKEWGRYRVNVNAVAFGFILTRLTEAT